MLSTNLYYFLIFSDHWEVIKLLLDEGADYKIVDREGNYFIYWIPEREHFNKCAAYVETHHPNDKEFKEKVSKYALEKEGDFSILDQLNKATKKLSKTYNY